MNLFQQAQSVKMIMIQQQQRRRHQNVKNTRLRSKEMRTDLFFRSRNK